MNARSKLLTSARLVNKSLLSIETFIMALITISLVACIFVEVVCRYFLFISVAWAEELTRYLFIWLTYIGSAYAIYDGSHTEIDMWQQIIIRSKIRDKARALASLEILAIVSTFLFLVAFGKIFFSYMVKIFQMAQASPTMHIPMSLVYLPVFVGVVLGAVHEVCLLLEHTVSRQAD